MHIAAAWIQYNTIQHNIILSRKLSERNFNKVDSYVVFQAIVANKLLYASPAWWGFASADDLNRLEGFLRRSAKLGYRATSTTFASMCSDADDQLFAKLTCNTQHLLYDLLPPLREQHYSLRERSHNYCLPDRASTLMDKNFLIRMLFKDLGCSQSRLTSL